MTADEIKTLIAAGLPCDHLDVQGDGRHWYATLVSSAFEGQGAIARHRRVHATLGDKLQSGQIHALSIKAYTPAEWAAEAPQNQDANGRSSL